MQDGKLVKCPYGNPIRVKKGVPRYNRKGLGPVQQYWTVEILSRFQFYIIFVYVSTSQRIQCSCALNPSYSPLHLIIFVFGKRNLIPKGAFSKMRGIPTRLVTDPNCHIKKHIMLNGIKVRYNSSS